MKRKWHSGPPPSVGWWPASVCEDELCFRWWNGKRWSAWTRSYITASFAAERAKQPAEWPNKKIRWTNRPANWPKRSRT